MKVKVSAILPNPFRNIKRYQLSREKVEALKVSMRATGVWPNLVVRKKKDRYELAYGHHRLQAAKELGYKSIEVTVEDLDDSKILRMMAGENLDVYRPTPSMMISTVEAAKRFLDDALRTAKSWDTFKESNLNKVIKVNSKQYSQLKRDGVGQTTILAFLGKNWKQSMVQEALKIISSESLDRNAIEQFPTRADARNFIKGIERANVPFEDQAPLARDLLSKGISGPEIERSIQDLKRKAESKSEKKPTKTELLIKALKQQCESLENTVSELLEHTPEKRYPKFDEITKTLSKSIPVEALEPIRMACDDFLSKTGKRKRSRISYLPGEVTRGEFLELLEIVKAGISNRMIRVETGNVHFTGDFICSSNGRILVTVPFETDFKGSIPFQELYRAVKKSKSDFLVLKEVEEDIQMNGDDGIHHFKKGALLDKVSKFVKNRENLTDWKSVPYGFLDGLKHCLLTNPVDLTKPELYGVFVSDTNMMSVDGKDWFQENEEFEGTAAWYQLSEGFDGSFLIRPDECTRIMQMGLNEYILRDRKMYLRKGDIILGLYFDKTEKRFPLERTKNLFESQEWTERPIRLPEQILSELDQCLEVYEGCHESDMFVLLLFSKNTLKICAYNERNGRKFVGNGRTISDAPKEKVGISVGLSKLSSVVGTGRMREFVMSKKRLLFVDEHRKAIIDCSTSESVS